MFVFAKVFMVKRIYPAVPADSSKYSFAQSVTIGIIINSCVDKNRRDGLSNFLMTISNEIYVE